MDEPLARPVDTISYRWNCRADFMRQTSYPQGLHRIFEKDEASGLVIQEMAPDGLASLIKVDLLILMNWAICPSAKLGRARCCFTWITIRKCSCSS